MTEFDHHPHRHQVVDLLEVLLLTAHLVDDAVDVLGTSAQLGADAHRLQLALQDLADIADEDLALLPPAAQLGLDGVEADRVELGEGEVLQLCLELPDAQPVSEGRVDVQGLPADALAPLLGVGAHGAHVVEAIGQLDQHHPDVLGHRHQHLADVLGLGLLPGVDVDLAQLGDPLDQPGDHLAELPPDVLQGDVGVLDGVVEQGRREGLRVEAELAEQDRRGHRMLDVGLPGQPELAAVGSLGDLERPPEQGVVGLGQVAEPGLEIGEGHLIRVYRAPGSGNPENVAAPAYDPSR